MKIAITAIITAHREGIMLGSTIRSFMECVTYTEEHLDVNIEKLLVLDSADTFTKEVAETCLDKGFVIFETEFKDQGLARNFAIEKSNGRYIAFLDGDDLWSYNWLVEAFKLCELDQGKIIAHPEYNWFFEMNNNIFMHVDQDEEYFDPDFLRFGNYWDALSLTPKEIHEKIPFCERNVEEGTAYEDWYWNILTFLEGFKHKVALNTIHFKRRREGSQTLQASKNKTLPLPNKHFKYSINARNYLGESNHT